MRRPRVKASAAVLLTLIAAALLWDVFAFLFLGPQETITGVVRGWSADWPWLGPVVLLVFAVLWVHLFCDFL